MQKHNYYYLFTLKDYNNNNNNNNNYFINEYNNIPAATDTLSESKPEGSDWSEGIQTAELQTLMTSFGKP